MANKKQDIQLKNGRPPNGSRSGAAEAPELKAWKDHPWVVALVAGGGTTIFWITVFMTVVVPTWNKSEENKVDELQHQLAIIGNDRDEKADTIKILTLGAEKAAEKVKGSENIHPESSIQADDPRLAALFADGDPYPRPFRQIRIGDPIERVVSDFGSAVTAGSGWYSVDMNTPPFDGVAYYEDSKLKVDGILFHTIDLSYQNKIDFSAIVKSQLVETFGQPDATAPDGGGKVRFCWRRKRVDFSVFSGGLSIYSASGKKLTCPP